MIKLTNQKLTISGHIIEYDFMDQPIKYGSNPSRKPPSPRTGKPTTPEKDRLETSINRAKANVRRLVNSNAHKWVNSDGQSYLPIFITLTFKNDIKDLKYASDCFKTAIQRLNYFVSGGSKKHILHYIAITEFQDKNRDGVIHYHVLFFNLPFIKQIYDEIKRIWRHGNVNVKSVRQVKNLGYYMVKYMSKNLTDGRLKGRKKYFSSKGLKKSQTLYDPDLIDLVVDLMPSKCNTGSFSWDNSYCGKITRTTFDVKDEPKALAWLYALVLK